MEAIIIHNLSSATVTLRGIYTLPNVVVRKGSSHLFNSMQEYQGYKDQIDRLVHAQILKVETVKQVTKTSVSMAVPAKKVEVTEPVKEDTATTEPQSEENTPNETKVETESKVNLPESKEDLKVLLKESQNKYKESTDEEEKALLKQEILAIKEKIKNLA